MQNIENYIDGLFRRAVDQAPLIPHSGSWDEVAVKIGKAKTSQFKKISGVFGFLFSGAIALTILTTFITHQEISTHYISSVHSGNSSKEKTNDSKDKDSKNSSTGINISQHKIVSSFTANVKKENSMISFNAIEGKPSGDFLVSAGNEEFKYSDALSSNNLKRNIQFVNPSSSIPFINDNHSSTQVNLNSFNNSRFYLGIAGGPLISQIKTQSLKKSGFDFGLLVGYRISKKFSLETGLLFTKQYYFSGGKYYNTATGGNTANSMEGSRTAFEIPFKLNYYVFRNRSGGLYISGGLSSFVGVNDKIIVNVGENPQHPPQKLDYGMASYFPSYLNIGLGYDFKSGRSTHFKIEPYLQIPLSNTAGNTININAGGALQVYNAGLHLIISEFIH
jgi:Outer membrane protein beta-barrel domain